MFTQSKLSSGAERTSDREHVITRVFKAPAQRVFEAWTTPTLLQRWWAPKSFGISFEACEVDARTGGSYRFVFSHPSMEQPMAFFGKYLDVVPGSRLVWTNEESGEGGAVTTVTFEEKNGTTRLVMHDLHPSKEALDEAVESGSLCGFDETFGQLDEVLASSVR